MSAITPAMRQAIERGDHRYKQTRSTFEEWCREHAPTFASRMVHVPHRLRRCPMLARVLFARARKVT